MNIQLKRAYDEPSPDDGVRLLVDRLWPRGVSKEKLHAEWIKDIAPSKELREWFAHDPKKWKEFQSRYARELETNVEGVEELKKAVHGKKSLTLVYAAKDEEHNDAVALKNWLEDNKLF